MSVHYVSPPAIKRAYHAIRILLCEEGELLPLTDPLRKEYENLYNNLTLRPNRLPDIDKQVTAIAEGRARYEIVSTATGVPWYVIGVIHTLECGGDFNCHLHNGDPLTSRTIHVPSGRPTLGRPPFLWETSAIDAMNYEGFPARKEWDLAGTLYKLEAYNGMGSRAHGIPTHYLWGGSTAYSHGNYVKDHVWNPFAISAQIGAAVLLKRMSENKVAEFPAGSWPTAPAPVLLAGSLPLIPPKPAPIPTPPIPVPIVALSTTAVSFSDKIRKFFGIV